MVKIKEIFKSRKAVLCITVLLFFCFLFLFSFISGSSANTLSPSSSHIVLNKWIDKNERKKSIADFEIKEDKTYYTVLDKIPCSQTKLIIKSENLNISIFTKGKTLYKSENNKLSGYGEYINIIDISDLKDGSVLYLRLSPVKKATGKIKPDILLTSLNDFILSLLVKNAKTIILCTAIFLLFLFFLILGTIRLIEKNKKAPKNLYFSCFLLILLFCFLFRSDISQLITKSSEVKYVARFSSYNLLGIFISSYICSAFKIKSKSAFILGLINLFYSALRIALLYFYGVSLSSLMIISHLFILLSVLVPLIRGRHAQPLQNS